MKHFKWLLISLFSINIVWANDWDIRVEKVKKDEFSELDKSFPGGAMPDNFQSVYIRFESKKTHFFIHDSMPTTTQYNKVLTCGNDSYPVVMLNTSGRDEQGSRIDISDYNYLYIFDSNLNPLKKFESVFTSEKTDDYYTISKQHIFTLKNVEDYACDQIRPPCESGKLLLAKCTFESGEIATICASPRRFFSMFTFRKLKSADFRLDKQGNDQYRFSVASSEFKDGDRPYKKDGKKYVVNGIKFNGDDKTFAFENHRTTSDSESLRFHGEFSISEGGQVVRREQCLQDHAFDEY
ncbi:hypothetical protein [Marinomonas posidonica]|uniref:Uncharacterized protein n=1 Tax=Marinomonas posidonica (strain CECT 7376 / NCIMB 14433 / IVIA-Po-181) TaxID=491952 RepID=F6CWU6_MARPP|nr:hypothetical protein [Marinomonas posidonica]AEF55508.1 hypothetical protein Mar181_2475 [Marinomonas posidonica IVIA-Po-181]